MTIDLTRLSKKISHALRHAPWVYEIELDDDGWVDAALLLSAIRESAPRWRGLSEDHLAAVMRSSSKQRYELADGRIRALYGHSVPLKLRREPATPPIHLFHGTSPAAAALIRESGLLPMRRQFVHLSMDRETAIAVGSRKAPRPIILIVRAEQASAAGVPFYLGNDKVWLADTVPPAFID